MALVEYGTSTIHYKGSTSIEGKCMCGFVIPTILVVATANKTLIMVYEETQQIKHPIGTEFACKRT